MTQIITVIASEAKQSRARQTVWIASSRSLLAMTARKRPGSLPAFYFFVDGRVIGAKTRFALLPRP